MRTVPNDPPVMVREWLARRQELGQDLYDEVWEGTYHVAPAPHPAHGYLDDQMAAILRPAALAACLVPSGPLNLGTADDYRVPDRALTRTLATTVFVQTAIVVVEIASPGDETWNKLGFYWAHGVEEVVIVDARRQTVTWFMRADDGFVEADRSRVLELTTGEVAAQIQWPPAA